MGAEGTRHSMGTKGARRKILPPCNPIVSLNPTVTLTPAPTLRPILIVPVPLALARIKYWDQTGGGKEHRRGDFKDK